LIFDHHAKLVEPFAADPHPPIADAIGTFSRAKSAGEGKPAVSAPRKAPSQTTARLAR